MLVKRKKRLLTGDTPTGRLHLGHWVGSLENRVQLQKEFDCYFLLANLHAFTTQANEPRAIYQSTQDIVLDYLSAGIDPQKSTIFVETEVPAIYELTCMLSMLLPYSRVMRNPTIKEEIRDKQLGKHYSFGFTLYAVMQVADILAFQAEIVPVGEDQIPHLEMTREVARRFNQCYCQVDPHRPDSQQVEAGGLFPIPEAKVGRVKRLMGLGGPSSNGHGLKMSKSLHNAIFLSDDADTLKKKIMGMYTDPNRLRSTDPGSIENNPLWTLHDTFNPDTHWLLETKKRYQKGQVGDVECKKKLIEVLVALLEPMWARRAQFSKDPGYIQQILKNGNEKANAVADGVLCQVKEAMQQQF